MKKLLLSLLMPGLMIGSALAQEANQENSLEVTAPAETTIDKTNDLQTKVQEDSTPNVSTDVTAIETTDADIDQPQAIVEESETIADIKTPVKAKDSELDMIDEDIPAVCPGLFSDEQEQIATDTTEKATPTVDKKAESNLNAIANNNIASETEVTAEVEEVVSPELTPNLDTETLTGDQVNNDELVV